jgi:hypothetical protein
MNRLFRQSARRPPFIRTVDGLRASYHARRARIRSTYSLLREVDMSEDGQRDKYLHPATSKSLWTTKDNSWHRVRDR